MNLKIENLRISKTTKEKLQSNYLNKNVTFDQSLNLRDNSDVQSMKMMQFGASPAAPPSNFGGTNTMGYNPMMNNMANMGAMPLGYPYPPQNRFYPQYSSQMQNMNGPMFGTPPNAPGMGQIPLIPTNIGQNLQFPGESAVQQNLNSSLLDSTLERDASILVEDGKKLNLFSKNR